MDLNWDAIGAIGEITGAFAVVISLVYLASQIRNQNRESRIASMHEITEAFRNAITSFQDPQRADVFTKALNEFDVLDDSQRLLIHINDAGPSKGLEEAYHQFEEHRLDDRMWKPMVMLYADLMSTHGFRRVWELRMHTYSDEFRVFVNHHDSGEYRLK